MRFQLSPSPQEKKKFESASWRIEIWEEEARKGLGISFSPRLIRLGRKLGIRKFEIFKKKFVIGNLGRRLYEVLNSLGVIIQTGA